MKKLYIFLGVAIIILVIINVFTIFGFANLNNNVSTSNDIRVNIMNLDELKSDFLKVVGTKNNYLLLRDSSSIDIFESYAKDVLVSLNSVTNDQSINPTDLSDITTKINNYLQISKEILNDSTLKTNTSELSSTIQNKILSLDNLEKSIISSISDIITNKRQQLNDNLTSISSGLGLQKYATQIISVIVTILVTGPSYFIKKILSSQNNLKGLFQGNFIELIKGKIGSDDSEKSKGSKDDNMLENETSCSNNSCIIIANTYIKSLENYCNYIIKNFKETNEVIEEISKNLETLKLQYLNLKNEGYIFTLEQFTEIEKSLAKLIFLNEQLPEYNNFILELAKDSFNTQE